MSLSKHKTKFIIFSKIAAKIAPQIAKANRRSHAVPNSQKIIMKTLFLERGN
jgi:hypothetical protein